MDDESTCVVNLLDADRGVLVVEVPIPDDWLADRDLRTAFCDGAGEAVAAMANVLWPAS